jgi:hypothetical protein
MFAKSRSPTRSSPGCLSSRSFRFLTEKHLSWNMATMKTTLDLPDELMREVKIRAVHERKKLKEVIAELLQAALGAGKPRRQRIPKPVKLRRGFIPTAEDIEAAIAEGRD